MKKFKFISAVLCLTVLLGFSVTTYAASKERAFTYNFKHQIAVQGTYKANETVAEFYIYTTTNRGSDTFFRVKQYKYNFWGVNPYQRQAEINCCANSSGYCSITTKIGTKYTYEFWKPTSVGHVVGSGSIRYQ